MRKIVLFAAAAALIPAYVGAWLASSTHARVDAAVDARINPMRMMVETRNLPVEHVVDLSLLD